ncbi:MAG: glycosyltransferase family 1 protein [Alphaproteobacteria bacterium]|nr:MAG: glycosyltransferase family 1 protein [Alphaproteobacteria bacterium]
MAEHQTVVGYIDEYVDGQIRGWIYSPQGNVTPIIRVNGFPGKVMEYPTQRNDVAKAVGVTPLCGFIAEPTDLAFGTMHVELLAVVNDVVMPVTSCTLKGNFFPSHIYSQLKAAKEISRLPGAVAITVWDGGHNPIGRAKVLYDIVTVERPAVIFSYNFSDFGYQLWKPLKESGVYVVTIPYHKRDQVFRFLAEEGICFDTVWVCKPRKHSFDLAQAVSHPNTACMVDIDDNEITFSNSEPSRLKPYGRFSINFAEDLLRQVPVRSCASKSLADRYDGTIVRHVRWPTEKSRVEEADPENFKLIFFGSVKPHKGLIELASAINLYNFITKKNVTLVVGGEFSPKGLRNELEDLGVTCLDEANETDLPELLSAYDAVITGYPVHPAQKDITDFQISSKIGDALRIGLPVLVPWSLSVADLEHPGIILFSERNFVDKLNEAMATREGVTLPDEFSTPCAYGTFSKLEASAQRSPRAGRIFPSVAAAATSSEKRKLVLVWKQHDAATYGRRIDQIARYYAHAQPDVEVYVLELISDVQRQAFYTRDPSFGREVELQNTMLRRKTFGYQQNNVHYHLIEYSDTLRDMSLSMVFSDFLDAKNIFPSNSAFVLFPFMQQFHALKPILSCFRVILDIVDNQASWFSAQQNQRRYLKQLYEMGSIAEKIILNSHKNRDHLIEAGVIPENKCEIIANWYWHPELPSLRRRPAAENKKIIYTGNMNDRMNWQLLARILDNVCRDGVTLHLAGPCERKPGPLEQVIANPYCVYHGVLSERETIELVLTASAAVICHSNDEFSKFMNPLKISMYEALGLPWLAPQMEGITSQHGATSIYECDRMLTERLSALMQSDEIHTLQPADEPLLEAQKYQWMIDTYLWDRNDDLIQLKQARH